MSKKNKELEDLKIENKNWRGNMESLLRKINKSYINRCIHEYEQYDEEKFTDDEIINGLFKKYDELEKQNQEIASKLGDLLLDKIEYIPDENPRYSHWVFEGREINYEGRDELIEQKGFVNALKSIESDIRNLKFELKEYHKQDNDKIKAKIKRILKNEELVTATQVIDYVKFYNHSDCKLNLPQLHNDLITEQFEQDFIDYEFKKLNKKEKLIEVTKNKEFCDLQYTMRDIINRYPELYDLVCELKEE